MHSHLWFRTKLFLMILFFAVQRTLICTNKEIKYITNTKFKSSNYELTHCDIIDNYMTPENLLNEFGPGSLELIPFYNPETGEYFEAEELETLTTWKNKREIYFLLSKSANISDWEEILVDDPSSLERTGFLKNSTTKIICHGFNSNFLEGPAKNLIPVYWKSAKMQTAPMNLILVDWSVLAGIHKVKGLSTEQTKKRNRNRFSFPPARNSELTGNETARLVKLLLEYGGITLDDIHLIGHSLGAQVMGYAGKYLGHTLGGKVSRITALDPAGPCFETITKVCLCCKFLPVSKSDAKFVDVIHTNARALAIKKPVGHADFYPNGGVSQPGCGFLHRDSCSHRRSIELMAESIGAPRMNFVSTVPSKQMGYII